MKILLHSRDEKIVDGIVVITNSCRPGQRSNGIAEAFQGFSHSAACIAVENADTSQVTSMVEIFWYESSFNADLSKWDVSRVTDMHTMFLHANSFNSDL